MLYLSRLPLESLLVAYAFCQSRRNASRTRQFTVTYGRIRGSLAHHLDRLFILAVIGGASLVQQVRKSISQCLMVDAEKGSSRSGRPSLECFANLLRR